MRYDTFDSNDTLEAKLLAGQSGYDVVVPTAYFLAREIKAGIFQKLDKSKLPNLAYVWPEIANRLAIYDPGNLYAVDYMWGTTGIGYNVKDVKEILGPDAAINSWDYVFDPDKIKKFKDCGIHLLNSSDDIMSAGLHYLHLDPNTSDPGELQKVTDLLMRIRPYVRKFHSSEYLNALATGEICFAVGWSGDVKQAQRRAADAKSGIEIGYSIPKEGAQLWFDTSRHSEGRAASRRKRHELINYLLKPEVAAKNTNYVWYANGDRPSQFIDPAILNDRTIYPDAATMANFYTIIAHGAEDAAADQPAVDADQDRGVTLCDNKAPIRRGVSRLGNGQRRSRSKSCQAEREEAQRGEDMTKFTKRSAPSRRSLIKSAARAGGRHCRAGACSRALGLCRLSGSPDQIRGRQYAGRPVRHRRPHRHRGAPAIDRQDLHRREPRRRRRQYRHGIRRACRAGRLHDPARDQRLFGQFRALQSSALRSVQGFRRRSANWPARRTRSSSNPICRRRP